MQPTTIISIWSQTSTRVSSAGCWGRTKVYRGYLLGSKYPTQVFGKFRHGLNTLSNTPVWFGAVSTPVPDTSVSSVRPPIIPPVPVSRLLIPNLTNTQLKTTRYVLNPSVEAGPSRVHDSLDRSLYVNSARPCTRIHMFCFSAEEKS